MNSQDLEHMLADIPCFIGVFCRDQLPLQINRRPVALIVNTDDCKDPGEHWLAIHLDSDGTGFYFDSFGLPPLDEHIFSFLVRHAPNRIDINKSVLQCTSSMSCGLFCALFIKLKCDSQNIENFFTKNCELNEILLKHYSRMTKV